MPEDGCPMWILNSASHQEPGPPRSGALTCSCCFLLRFKTANPIEKMTMLVTISENTAPDRFSIPGTPACSGSVDNTPAASPRGIATASSVFLCHFFLLFPGDSTRIRGAGSTYFEVVGSRNHSLDAPRNNITSAITSPSI